MKNNIRDHLFNYKLKNELFKLDNNKMSINIFLLLLLILIIFIFLYFKYQYKLKKNK